MRPPLTVYFNGGCSVCGPEVAMYVRLADQAGVTDLVFEDIAAGPLPEGFARDTLLKRIHAREGETMLVGVEAFIAMWLRLPKFRFLAYAINWPVMRNMTGLIYDRFVAPWLYRRYRAKQCDIASN